MPPPNVDSCVVQFELRDKTPDGVSNEAFFFKVARGAFSQRRKTLCNSVSSALGIDKQTVAKAIESAQLDISPDGKSIAYSSYSHPGQRVIKIIDIDSQEKRVLDIPQRNVYMGSWNNKGKYIFKPSS